MSHGMSSILTRWLLLIPLVVGASQPPRRVGMQVFRLMDTLWIHGGRFLHENGSVAVEIESSLQSYNLTLDFQIPDGPVPQDPRITKTSAPTVYHGFIFNNLIDRAWLFGGRPVDPNITSAPLANDVWRFEPGSDTPWTQLSLSSWNNDLKLDRPYRGAGCNVPDLERGYYLGGMTDSERVGSPPRFSHWLYEFNMRDETLNTFPVPSFVPVINQSLVFVDTGMRKRALVVLGGSVESNGSLSPAPLTSIFVFDIESQIWIQQSVTGLDGDLNQDGTVDIEPPNGGIPRTRGSACAAVGSAQDKTSHNIFYLGGVNETMSVADIWVLSLPSAVWIKALPVESASSPKYENSCFAINDRFIWMFGGCFLDPRGPTPCVAYSYNPLVYDMAELRIQHYTRSINGFFIHKNITDVIGGRPDGTGGALVKAPIYTNFSHPLLEELFTAPESDPLLTSESIYSDHRVLIHITIFLALPPLIAVVISLLAIPFRKYILSKWLFVSPRKPWHPTVFRPTFLILLNLIPIFLIALLWILTDISQLPDANAGHWSGGLDSDGVWTGTRFESTFIRSPTLSRPVQGLISFYQDIKPTGIWNQKNATQRIGNGNYWAFSYLPTLVFILYGRLWKVLDDEVKRLDKYIRLSKPEGERLGDSLFLDYHSFWVPLSLFQALRRRHGRVAISSLGMMLGSIVAPIIQNYTFGWTLYSGAHLAWPDTYSWLVALVDPWWSNVLIGALLASLVCSLSLLMMLTRTKTGLREDPRGLASILYLVPRGSPLFEKSSNMKSLSELEEDLGDRWVRLVTIPNNPTPVLEDMKTTPVPQATPGRFLTSCIRPWTGNGKLRPVVDLFSWMMSKVQNSPPYRVTHAYFTDFPLSFPFRPEMLGLWFLLLASLLILSSILATGLNQNARDQLWNYSIPLSPNIYLVLAIFAQSIADVIDFSIRSIYPFYELHKGAQSSEILFVDYAASLSDSGPFSVIPIIDVISAWRRGHHLICASILASMAITVVTVFFGSLQLSSSYYGATTFVSDQTAATGAAWLVGLALVVYIVLVSKIYPALRLRMRRPVETFMGTAPYLVFSDRLRADLMEVAKYSGDNPRRVTELYGSGKRYAFGMWTEGATRQRMFGVERQYDHAGRVDTMSAF